jgi:hypothetical protein
MTYKEKVSIRNKIDAIPGRAGRVREAARILSEFCVAGIEDLMARDDSAAAIRNTILEFMKTGEVVRLAPGRYRYAGHEKRRTYIDIIWHLVRSHRSFDAQDLERLSGAALSTVKEYLWCLKKLGYLRRSGHGAWQLISDPGPDAPVNAAKCSRLKRIRTKKKEAENGKA